MRASLEWIKELLPQLKAPAAAVERRLTAAGIEVEGVQHEAELYRGVVVGEVRAVDRHPGADQLSVTRVWDGEHEHVVVCGAPNVAAGQKVAFARVGATLPNGLTLAAREIRGVTSHGMLCSEKELGLSQSGEGILVLKPRSRPGKPLAEALDLKDVRFELSVTPNRPDVLSHFGLARELAGLFGLPLPKPSVRLKEHKRAAVEDAEVQIRDEKRCPRYFGRVILGVKVGPSPAWVVKRLEGVGLRSISNVVDATNLVLMELGHPLHAFDLARLHERRVVVRTAMSGEKLKLLDGTEHELVPDDFVIADADRPVALAGVMGGAETEVTEATTDLLIESAWFQPASVRRTAKRHGLHTEASHRFERGADPEMLEAAIDRVSALIVELAGGQISKGRLVAGKGSPPPPVVPIRPERATLVIGRPVGKAEIREVMRSLGAQPRKGPAGKEKPERRYADALWFQVPSWRVDLRAEEDLIEEVARLGGYDNIPTSMPSGSKEVWSKVAEPDPEHAVRAALVGLGFYEAISLAFASERDLGPLGFPSASAVRLANPLGEETRLLRVSLLPPLLEAVRLNQDQLPSRTDLRLFEIGRTFRWAPDPGPLPEETPRLALVMRGGRQPPMWSEKVPGLDAFDLKGQLELLFARLGLRPVAHLPHEAPFLHPRSATRIVAAGDGQRDLGVYGELAPRAQSAFAIEGPPVFVAELDLAALLAHRAPLTPVAPLPKFPPAQRDLSFFLDRRHAAARILAVVREVGQDLQAVDIFDVYEGQGVREGHKSVAISLVFRAPDRTLTDEEVESRQGQIVAALRSTLGAELRSGG